MRRVAVLAVPDVVAFDMSIPVEVFGRVRLANGSNGYRVQVCGIEPLVSAGPLRIATDHGLESLAAADTIIVPGRETFLTDIPAEVVTALRAAYAAGATIASICTGAFCLLPQACWTGNTPPRTGPRPTYSASPFRPSISIPTPSTSMKGGS